MNNSLINSINEIYGSDNLPQELINLINNKINYTFINKRVLSFDEIINANNYLQVDFISLKLIPVIDCFDNDFICYDFENNVWLIFNIVDEIRFKRSKIFNELLNYKN